MRWPFTRREPPLPAGHELCERAIARYEKIIARQEQEIESLHEKLLQMHGYGYAEHQRALEQRKALGPTAVKLFEHGDDTLQNELEKAVHSAGDRDDEPHALEVPPAPPRRNGSRSEPLTDDQ